MLYDLATILLIIGFSFLFKISITKGYDEQLIFILLALVVMVIYKYLTYRYMMRSGKIAGNTEPYLDFTDEMNKFLGQDIPNGINQGNINEYKSQIAVLQDKVDTMNEYLKDLNNRSTTSDANKAAIGGLDFQTGQQIQDYRIKKAQQDIARTADLIKQNRLAEDAKKYNKIKVFSSCVVAGADGSYSKDMPSASASAASSGPSMMVNPLTGGTVGGTPSSIAVGGSSAQAPAIAAGSSLGAGSGVNINDILQTIANNGIDINLM
jgi:hypothetical protein